MADTGERSAVTEAPTSLAEGSAGVRDWLTGLGYALLFDRHDVLALDTGRFDPALVRIRQDLLATARAN